MSNFSGNIIHKENQRQVKIILACTNQWLHSKWNLIIKRGMDLKKEIHDFKVQIKPHSKRISILLTTKY